jgi:hypothetical protein
MAEFMHVSRQSSRIHILDDPFSILTQEDLNAELRKRFLFDRDGIVYLTDLIRD